MAERPRTLRDVMTRDVITVEAALAASRALEILCELHITGAPVVDAGGRVVGVVGVWDLVTQRAYDGASTVGEIMTPHVVSMDPDRSVTYAARLMLADDIHRIVVLEDGELVGLVTAMGLLQVVAALEP